MPGPELDQPQVVVRRDQARVQAQSLAQDRGSLVVPAQLAQDLAPRPMIGGDLGPPFDRPFDPVQSLVFLPSLAEHDAQQVQGVVVVGLDGEQRPITALGLFQASGTMVSHRCVKPAAHQAPWNVLTDQERSSRIVTEPRRHRLGNPQQLAAIGVVGSGHPSNASLIGASSHQPRAQ